MFKKIKYLLIIIMLLLPSLSLATDSLYVWSDLDSSIPTAASVLNHKEGNFLNLTCGSAILIEQTGRHCSL